MQGVNQSLLLALSLLLLNFLKMEYKIKYEHLSQYLFGGKADIILKDIRNNDYINFFIIKKFNTYIVYYKTFKLIEIATIIITSNFYALNLNKNNIDKDYTKIFNQFFTMIYLERKTPSNIEVYYTGKCSVCGRTLKNPKYIEIGIGSECLKK
jgi:hypothetical protein